MDNLVIPIVWVWFCGGFIVGMAVFIAIAVGIGRKINKE